MLPECLRILTLSPGAVTVVPNGGFKSNAPVGIDRIACPRQDRSSHPAVGIEVCSLGAPPCDDIAAVASHQKPVACLVFKLDDVQHVFVGAQVNGSEIPRFRFDGKPAQRNRYIATYHSLFRIKFAHSESSRNRFIGREMTETAVV